MTHGISLALSQTVVHLVARPQYELLLVGLLGEQVPAWGGVPLPRAGEFEYHPAHGHIILFPPQLECPKLKTRVASSHSKPDVAEAHKNNKLTHGATRGSSRRGPVSLQVSPT